MEKKEPAPLQFSHALESALRDYMRALDGETCSGMHAMTIAVTEKCVFNFALKHCRGNLSSAAKMLGISRTTLLRKVKQYKIQR